MGEYIQHNALRLLFLTEQHIELVLLSVAISTVVGITLALATQHRPDLRGALLSIAATILTVPSFALFALAIRHPAGRPPAAPHRRAQHRPRTRDDRDAARPAGCSVA